MFFKKKQSADPINLQTDSSNTFNDLSKLQQELAEKDEHLNHAISEINRLNQYIMKMDFVKDMILNLNIQLENIEMVAASSQEISASIIEIAEHVVDNTKSAEKSVDITAKGTQALQNAVKSIDSAFDMTNAAKARVEDVTMHADRINEMVGIIDAVAGQTNLLALNASIEAARAGEAGRGFAVVADEIKKLAEHTKQSAKLIQETVSSLNGSVKESVSSIDQATQTFKVGITDINHATQLVESSDAEIRTILSSMMLVRDQIEAQTAASEEVASSVAQINESTKQLHKETTQTGKAFSDIALEVNDIRLELLKRHSDLPTSILLEMTITDHMNWKWNVYNMLMGFQKIQSEKLISQKDCRLGKWIDQFGKQVPEFQNAIKKIEAPHEALHKAAADAVRHYNAGNIAAAEDQLSKIDSASRLIVNELSHMLAIAIEHEGNARKKSYFRWTSDLTVYNAEIDDQHKQLLKIGEKLETFSQSSNKSKAAFIAVAEELKAYTVYHFGHEESLLIKSRYPDIERHQKIHKAFIDQIEAVDLEHFDYNDSEALKGLINFLSQWVVKHIKNEDFKYANHLNKY